MYRKSKKIPSLIVFLFIIIGIISVLYFDERTKALIFPSKLNPQSLDIHFTNITDSSFTISWFTSNGTIGTAEISDGSTKSKFLDNLDSDNISRKRKTHYITTRNLKENTNYTVKISDGDNYCIDNSNCSSYTIKTTNKLLTSFEMSPARGIIVDKDGFPISGAIVYLIVSDSLPLSNITDSSGLWVVPFNNLRANNHLDRPNLSDNDIIQLFAKASDSEIATGVIDVKSIRQNLVIPDIKIGNSYNFIDLIAKKDLLASSMNQRILGVKTQLDGNPNTFSQQTDTYTNPSLDILFPKHDDDFTPDNKPRLRGIGKPGSSLLITVNSSTPQTGSVIVAADGTWVWRPTQALEPGIHYISIQGYDENGKTITIKRKFIVLKSGESVLGESTPSASLTPSPSPTISTITPTLSPTVNPSPTPVISITPTPTSISTPTTTLTSTPSQTPTSIPTPTSQNAPRTGNTTSTMVLIVGSASLLLVGIKLLLFS